MSDPAPVNWAAIPVRRSKMSDAVVGGLGCDSLKSRTLQLGGRRWAMVVAQCLAPRMFAITCFEYGYGNADGYDGRATRCTTVLLLLGALVGIQGWMRYHRYPPQRLLNILGLRL